MNIVVIGAGTMGSIYGGHLSEHNDVIMVDTSPAVVERINEDGLRLQEDGEDRVFRPKALIDATGIKTADLIMVFVKAMFTRTALVQNRHLIGPDTYVMSLQNGVGHEDILSEFVPMERVIIGTTNDNGVILEPGYIRHTGDGETNFGLPSGRETDFLKYLEDNLNCCGFRAKASENIRQLIWDKLFINISLSAVTGILQTDMGYIAANPYAWKMTEGLVREAAAVARGKGFEADEQKILEKVRATSLRSPAGCTSIRADLRDGRKTEVEFISGYVVRAAKECGISVPLHQFVVQMIHAMEALK